jgi:hypothetical protein
MPMRCGDNADAVWRPVAVTAVKLGRAGHPPGGRARLSGRYRVKAIAKGLPPTLIAWPVLPVAIRIGVTVLE